MAGQLVEAHIAAMARLRAIVARAVELAWAGLPGYDAVNVAEFLSQAVPVVLAGQDHAVALTDAYLARASGRRPFGLDPAGLTGAAVRNGTPPEEVYRRAFVSVWSGLSDGKRWADAVTIGGERATSAAAMDVQLSMRATAAAVQEADDGIAGYRRVPNANACSYCRAAGGSFVKNATAHGLHHFCGCSLEPVPAVPGTEALPAGVAVAQHGELGALLVDPAEHFTKL